MCHSRPFSQRPVRVHTDKYLVGFWETEHFSSAGALSMVFNGVLGKRARH